MILAIETSCDDTSVAVLDAQGVVLAMRSAHQDDSHRPFGGVVPEVASRRHSEVLLPTLEATLGEASVDWPQIKGLAVTARPGLIGSLLVGLVTAKTLSLVHGIPFVGVNHIEGHLVAALLRDKTYAPPPGFDFPYLGLAVSGGHTHLFICEAPGRYRLIGQTVDDAAGEAFDKFAKMLRLGFPGGVAVDRAAAGGDVAAFHFPRAMQGDSGFNFSFSGLKTAAQRTLSELSEEQQTNRRADLCASYQEAIVSVLVDRMVRASKQHKIKNWTVTGGVSANSRLRLRMAEVAASAGATLALPPLRYCTDNAAMIGLAGLYRLQAGESAGQELSPSARSLVTDWTHT